MVQEDERKLDVLTKRHTELTMVNNNSKLLNEMLDHYDKTSCGAPELDLLKELFQSCEKMQPKLFRMAAESTDEAETGTEMEENDGGGIMDILNASDDLTKVIDRYKMVIIQGKVDITKGLVKQSSDTLLDLDLVSENHVKQSKNSSALLEEDLLGLGLTNNSTQAGNEVSLSTNNDKTHNIIKNEEPNLIKINASTIREQCKASVDDLLMEGSPISSTPVLASSNIASHIPKHPSPFIAIGDPDSVGATEKTSRQRGLEELDLLGEVAIKSHLPTKNERSPQFAKKDAKLSMNELKQQKMEKELKNSGSSEQISSQKAMLETSQQTNAVQVTAALTIGLSDHTEHNALNTLGEKSSNQNGLPSSATNSSLSSSNCDIDSKTIYKTESSQNVKETVVNANNLKEEIISTIECKGATFIY